MTSKNIGIGSAERHWKIVKAVNNGKRSNTVTINCKKQAFLYGANMHKNSRCRQARIISAIMLWSDNDFQGCKMDIFCNEIMDSLEMTKSNDGEVRIFNARVETW